MKIKSDNQDDMYEGLPIALRDIADQIIEDKAYLNHECDQTDDESRKMDAYCFELAASFIRDYALYVYKHYSIILVTPDIDVLKGGDVGVLWENSLTEFLIIFKKENSNTAFFVAKYKTKDIPFVSGIEIGKPVEEFLAVWMKHNLS